MIEKIPQEISDRALAFRILKTHEEGRRIDRALSDGLRAVKTPGRGLVTELVNGVVRQKGRLDFHLLFFYPGVSVHFLPKSGRS